MNGTAWLALCLSVLVSLVGFFVAWSSYKAHQRDTLIEQQKNLE